MTNDSDKIIPDASSTPSFVRPFLQALNQMNADEVLRPAQYEERSNRVLVDRLGVNGALPTAGFAKGVVGVMADHTHYFDGFALLLGIKPGIAVSLRSNEESMSRVVVEHSSEVMKIGDNDDGSQGLAGLIREALRSTAPVDSDHFDIAIFGTIPTGLGAAFHASFTIALLRALHAWYDLEMNEGIIRDRAISALTHWYGHAFSPAYVLGVLKNAHTPFVLVDTNTMESIPLEGPKATQPGWGIVEWETGFEQGFKHALARTKLADRALSDLQSGAFSTLQSFRDLEHRDLQRAIDDAPRRSRSTIKHLVSENRNVQKLVVAIKKGDWQFVGAILMISQASKAGDWNTTDSIHAKLMEETDSASLDGIFGAVQTGEGGNLLVLGQPFSLPSFLDHLKEKASAHTKEEIETFIV